MTRGTITVIIVIAAVVVPQWIGVAVDRNLARANRPHLSWLPVITPASVFALASLALWWHVASEANARSLASTGRPADGTFLLMMVLNTALFSVIHFLVAVALQKRLRSKAERMSA